MLLNKRVWYGLGLSILALTLGACDALQPVPTPTQELEYSATQLPKATVGPLAMVDAPQVGISLLAPSGWPAPVAFADSAVILSPTGSTDTSYTAGPFMLIADAGKLAQSRIGYTLRSDISDPSQQLDLLVQGINQDAPSFTRARPFTTANYPAASVVGFDRDNELTIILLNLGNGHWLYVGIQALQRNYSYYEQNVFNPVVNSITVKTP
ncbi:MAG TPA: hypothetical protein VKQ72_00115 [Aggregatilineales bacterium]|nr:hypothetical protein [Aggregatilineales bacterium]